MGRAPASARLKEVIHKRSRYRSIQLRLLLLSRIGDGAFEDCTLVEATEPNPKRVKKSQSFWMRLWEGLTHEELAQDIQQDGRDQKYRTASAGWT